MSMSRVTAFTFALLLAGLTLGQAASIQRVVVLAQTKDPQIAEAVEFQVQTALADHGVASERYSKLFSSTSTLTPAEIVKRMKAGSFDSLLCLRPERNIQFPDIHASTSTATPLERALSAPAPSAHAVQMAPPEDVGRQTIPGLESRNAGPIDGNQGPSGKQVLKVGAFVFDMNSGQAIWEGSFPVRASKDMPSARYQKLVAEGAAKTLFDANLIPSKR